MNDASKHLWFQRAILSAACALVIAVYLYAAHSGFVISLSRNAADDYYNLLVQGFRVGQLNLKTEVPPGLAQLADPYDPRASARYPVLDMSYYRGKLYLYYGATPAVLLFWPYVALTGNYLPQKNAVAFFCIVGFLTSVALLYALWRRYFAEISVAVIAAGILALGLVTCIPVLLVRSDVWEVPISCGYALTMLTLAAIWKALHDPRRRCWWLAGASLAYGLALGARPNLLFGACVLFIPVIQAWRERQRVWMPLMAAVGPLALIGLGLMFYNALRFDNPFEFGLRYALSGDRSTTVRPFSLRYLWFHFRVYFFALARWSNRFPFVRDIKVPPLPAGHGVVEHPFGVLTNLPVVSLALAVPLAWRGRSAETRSILCGFLAAVAVLFGISVLTLSFFFSASIRYEVEFLPALVLLAVIGILSSERTSACRPFRRRVLCWCWSLLLSLSVAFALLLNVNRYAEAHFNFGAALQRVGQTQEAMMEYRRALNILPDYAEVHNDLGLALQETGQSEEAIEHFKEAVRLSPNYAEAHYNLGAALQRLNQLPLAIEQYEQAVCIKPEFVEGHNNLGVALSRVGLIDAAIDHYRQAVLLKPEFAEAHFNLGIALERAGRRQEAIEHYEQALRFRPDFAEAQQGLERARVGR